MNRFFFGNFDFEEQLRGETQRTARIERLMLELASAWLAIADADDRIWCPGRLPEDYLASLAEWGLPSDIFVSEASCIPKGMELVPWGWSTSAVEFGEKHGLIVNSPPLDVVRLANSREYSVSMEMAAGDEPQIATLYRTYEQVSERIFRTPDNTRWAIKANWSHAARERLLLRGRGLPGPDSSWINQRLARDGVVCWEPWLQREAEIGIQWHITPGQPPELVAITELLVDPRGQYTGTRSFSSSPPLPEWISHAVEVTRTAVTDLAHRGYFGPVGIDSMRYFDPASNTSHTRPLQDINARWTMGRLAAGWFEKLGRPATWRHGPWQSTDGDPPGTHWIATAPERINGSPVNHRTWLSGPVSNELEVCTAEEAENSCAAQTPVGVIAPLIPSAILRDLCGE